MAATTATAIATHVHGRWKRRDRDRDSGARARTRARGRVEQPNSQHGGISTKSRGPTMSHGECSKRKHESW